MNVNSANPLNYPLPSDIVRSFKIFPNHIPGATVKGSCMTLEAVRQLIDATCPRRRLAGYSNRLGLPFIHFGRPPTFPPGRKTGRLRRMVGRLLKKKMVWSPEHPVRIRPHHRSHCLACNAFGFMEGFTRRFFSTRSAIDYFRARSKRSKFMTLSHTAIKSRRNLSWESALA